MQTAKLKSRLKMTSRKICMQIGQMLERGVEKSRVVVWRRRAILVRLPITGQDRRLVVTETCDVIAQERHVVVPALREGEEPLTHKKTNILIQSLVGGESKVSEIRCHHLLSFTFLPPLFNVRCFSSSDGRTMPLSLCSP